MARAEHINKSLLHMGRTRIVNALPELPQLLQEEAVRFANYIRNDHSLSHDVQMLPTWIKSRLQVQSFSYTYALSLGVVHTFLRLGKRVKENFQPVQESL